MSSGPCMTALAAVFHRDGRQVEQPKFKRVADALQPFGAPGTEPWCDGPVGLVGASDTRFQAENALDGQPTAAGAKLLLFDGLLANRRALIDALGIERRRAAQQADSALFARAWDRWGEAAALRAEGAFSAIVWDPRSRVLSAVCSPLDAPPLYYAVDRRRAILATAPRAIFAWGDLRRRIDDAVLASSMINDSGDGRATCYHGVSSLLAGELLTVSPNAARVRRYYDLAEQARPTRLRTDADYVDAAGELLRNAVESAMRALQTPAVLLSGGLDSSTIAVVALESLAGRGDPTPLVSLTGMLGSNGRRDETRNRVRALAAMQPALDARFVDCGRLDSEQPAESAAGVDRRPAGGASRPVLSLAALRAVRKSSAPTAQRGTPVRLRAARLAGLQCHSSGVRSREPGRPARPRIGFRSPWARPLVGRGRALGALGNHRRRHYYRGVIRAGEAAYGVQFRSPFYNRPLVEWAVGLPVEQFLHRGQSRRLIRRVMEGRLPTEVMDGCRLGPERDTAIHDLPGVRGTLERWRNDPSVAERLDLARLLRLLEALPQVPNTRRNYSDYMFVRRGLDHALAVGRFIRWAEGGSNWAQA